MFFRKRSREPENVFQGSLRGGKPEGIPPSVIGVNTRFRGELRGSSPLIIRGHVEGFLRMQDLVVVEPGSFLRAGVRAPEMIVAGSAEGEIRIQDTLTLRSSGELQGDVESGSIRVEEGAVLRGSVRHVGTGREPSPKQSTD